MDFFFVRRGFGQCPQTFGAIAASQLRCAEWQVSKLAASCKSAEDALAGGAGCWAEGLKGIGEGFKDAGLDGEEVKFAFAANVDESAGLQFLDVVRKRGG